MCLAFPKIDFFACFFSVFKFQFCFLLSICFILILLPVLKYAPILKTSRKRAKLLFISFIILNSL